MAKGHELNGKPTNRVAEIVAGKRRPKADAVPVAVDPLIRWAKAGIGLSLVLSAGLNGYANAEHCRAGLEWAGWLLGCAVPGLVLVLSRVAGGAYARGWRYLAAAGAVVVLALLGLSVKHCAHSFSALTGADAVSAVLWAVGIDTGLVVCELLTVGRKGK